MRRRVEPPSIAPSLSDLEADLERWAQETGESAYLRAARALWHQPAGRPAIDDRFLIAQVHQAIAAGAAQSTADAIRMIARAAGPSHEEAVARRLRRKLAANRKKVRTK